MKKVILILFLICLRSPSEKTYTYYFPFAPNIPNVGIAWYAQPATVEKLQSLNAYYYYHSETCSINDNRAIGIVRHHYDWQNCQNNNILLVGNEGEHWNQDNLPPQQMAQFILNVRELYPNSTLVCLNSYSIDYVNIVLTELDNDICDYVGLHIYRNTELYDNFDLIETINFNGDFWITEIGWSNDDPIVYDTFYNLVYGVHNHPRVKMIFAYTATHAHIQSYEMIDESTSLVLPNGQAFRDAVEAYP